MIRGVIVTRELGEGLHHEVAVRDVDFLRRSLLVLVAGRPVSFDLRLAVVFQSRCRLAVKLAVLSAESDGGRAEAVSVGGRR